MQYNITPDKPMLPHTAEGVVPSPGNKTIYNLAIENLKCKKWKQKAKNLQEMY